MARFDHILVANRGEIAVRVIRTARALGYRTTAVYSDADADAPHVRLADEARLIGPAAASQSYLSIDRILAAATASGVGAIHPGYGFLSENADFANACEAAGITFIGPRADSIELMGNKARAKDRMIVAGVPCVPGYQGDQSDEALRAAAAEIGYPIMIKAAAGGGGRGMRLAQDEATLTSGLATARSEALNAFGSDEMILEKAILRPRHVEVQILADEHGAILHLGERDCSVQRRHQKIIEEAPSPAVNSATRKAMTDAAIAVARAIGYRGAGTVEFIVDEAARFYFIEMNTRLQVEHPVTEAITGIDLVAQQIHIAQGQPLAIAQDDVRLHGHAIEARLYAEDPAHGFLPSTGHVDAWKPPEMPGIRVDAGIRTGQEITPYYDPMLAKIIAHGTDRNEALARLLGALDRTTLLGPTSNIAFLRSCLGAEAFVTGDATTAFIEEAFPDGLDEADPPETLIAIAAILFFDTDCAEALAASVSVPPAMIGWTSGGDPSVTIDIDRGDRRWAVHLTSHGPDVKRVRIDAGATMSIERIDETTFLVDQRRIKVAAHVDPFSVQIAAEGVTARFDRDDPLGFRTGDEAAETSILAPMHGAIMAVDVTEGDIVERGTRLVVLEAMKMQHELKASIDARVVRVLVRAGEQAPAGALLMELEPLAEA